MFAFATSALLHIFAGTYIHEKGQFLVSVFEDSSVLLHSRAGEIILEGNLKTSDILSTHEGDVCFKFRIVETSQTSVRIEWLSNLAASAHRSVDVARHCIALTGLYSVQ